MNDIEFFVARRVRAWIETILELPMNLSKDVARRVRAWIETIYGKFAQTVGKGRTPCACVD